MKQNVEFGFQIVFSWIITCFLFASPALSQEVLTHGPVFGGVLKYRANVFVRTNQAAVVELQYGVDPALSTFRTTAPTQTISASDFTAIIPLTGLSKNKRHYVNILVNGDPQFSWPFPSFKTFPKDPQDFKFIILTDFKNQRIATIEFPTFLSASVEDYPPVAFAFIGGDFDHRNPRTLKAKRQMFKDLYDPALLGPNDFVHKILRQMPVIHHWDDHDAGMNNIDKMYADWDLSHQAYTEYVPSYAMTGTRPGIWQKIHYGNVDFFVLDNRSQRDPATDPDDADKSMLDGNAVGKGGQLSWLKFRLLKSASQWKIIFSSVVTNPYTKFEEGWAAYQTEWNELRDFIEENGITRVVFISGDLHIGAIDDGSASGFVEMVVPAANLTPKNGIGCATGQEGRWTEGVFGNDDGPCHGYGVVTVLTNPDQLILEVKDGDGNTRVTYTVF